MRTSDFPVVPSKDSSNPIAQPPFTLSFPYSFPTSFPLMKPIRFPHLLLISSLAALPATADTVKLKNGKVYEGTATERGDVIDIEIPMGKIIDHQTVKKSDVAEFTKTLPDEKEAADLASLVPTADAKLAADNAARNASSASPATIPGTTAAAVTPAANPLPSSGAVPAAPPTPKPEAPKPAPAKTEAPKPAPSPATVADPNPVSEPQPESNLPLFLGGGAGLLFLVAILAKFLGKKKSED